MIGYSDQKYPPAPVLEIRISRPLQAPQTDPLLALVDTGSDASLIPLRLLRAIQAPSVKPAYIRGMWSGRQMTTIYLIDLHLASGVLPDIEVVGVNDDVDEFENEDIILGRNVLNKLILLLEGPQQQTTILERRPRRF